MEIINKLISASIIKAHMGPLKNFPKIALVVWARNPPKSAFAYLVEISRIINKKNDPVIFVDDLCSMLDTGRTTVEQALTNAQYENFFTALSCKTIFSSSVMKNHDFLSMTRELDPLSKKVTFNEFKNCLPLEKRADIQNLGIVEYYHFLLELWMLDHASTKADTVIAGIFSQAILACHRNVSKKPMTAILLPKVNETDFEKNYSKIQQVLAK